MRACADWKRDASNVPILGADGLPELVPAQRKCECGAARCLKLAARAYRLNPSWEAAALLLEYRAEIQARAAEREGGLSRGECLSKLASAGVPVTTCVALRDLKWDETAALLAARAFMAERKSSVLYLSGPPGVGKTFAAAWCLFEFARTWPWDSQPSGGNQREAVAFTTATEIASLSVFDKSDVEHLARLEKSRLCLVDDLGQEGTEFGRKQLAEMLCVRVDNRRATILTSNVMRPGAVRELYGPKLHDRLELALRPVLESRSKRSGKQWGRDGVA